MVFVVVGHNGPGAGCVVNGAAVALRELILCAVHATRPNTVLSKVYLG